MSMGYSASYAETISEENLRKICPEELDTFLGLFGDKGLCGSLEDAARSLEWQDGDCVETVDNAYLDIQSAFKTKTDGLELHIGYHNSSEEGDRNDEVDGVYWAVDGVYEHTPAGKKLRDVIERKFWINFG